MDVKIKKVECFKLALPRDTPYLGQLGPNDRLTDNGCFIRAENGGMYSLKDHSLLVKVTTDSGHYGWGECVTVIAPQVAEAIVKEILAPQVLDRNPLNVIQITEDLYNTNRIRGFFGGFFMDAICALDIALWDLKAKLLGVPVCQLLGGERTHKLKAYVSGLPESTAEGRARLAKEWVDKGFDTIKVPIIYNLEHPEKEMESLRKAVGPDVKLMVDMHWKYTANEAIRVINKMDQFDLYVAEAPCKAEDMDGQAQVTANVGVNVAIGEELRTVFEYSPRFAKRCMNIIQPEMGRTGLTQFWHISQMARTYHQLLMPHGSIGIGIFLSASLHASAASSQFACHEYQHSIVDKNLKYLKGNLSCSEGYFHLPDGIGLGVEPTEDVIEHYVMP